jgi:uncharacterized membrane protein
MDEFLKTLMRSLKAMSAQEKQDIIDDYREHFEAGLEAGKTEEQVAAALGDPTQLAKMHTMQSTAKAAHESKAIGDTMRMIGAALSYKAGGGIVIGCLYFVCLTVLISLFAIAAGLVLIGIGCLVLIAVEIGASYIFYAMLALFAALIFVPGGLLTFKGSAKLWRISLGRMPLLARRVMRMEKEAAV